MDLSSIYMSLKRTMDSDPEYFSMFEHENGPSTNYEFLYGEVDGNDEWDYDGEGQVKRAKLDNSIIPIEAPRKVIFIVDEKEFRSIQQRSHNLLEELFTLTLNWPSGKVLKLLANHDSTDKAIKYNFCFRNSVFDAPLVNIPTELKSPITRIPRIIVLLMKSLSRPESLKTIGAFRVEVSNTRCDYYQDLIDAKLGKTEETSIIWLDEIPIVAKMTILKRYFRKIPGSLVDRVITELFYE